MGKGKDLTLGFIAVAAVVCLAYLVWGQYNTAQTIYYAAFMQQGAEHLLNSDPDYLLSNTEEEAQKTLEAGRDAWLGENAPEARSFKTSDGITLSWDWYDAGSGATVILLHGYMQDKSDAEVLAPYWAGKGFNIAAVDLRGFGQSEGVTSLGMYESRDVRELIASEFQGDKIILHGMGAGAVAALLAADGADLVIADSAFSNLETFAEYQVKKQFSLPRFPALFFLDLAMKNGSGFGLKDLDPLGAAAGMSAPAVFVAGEADKFTPPSMTRELCQAWGGGEKRLVLFDGVRHRQAYAMQKDDYEAALDLALASANLD